MNSNSDPSRPIPGPQPTGEPGDGEQAVPLGGTRAKAVQRLQVGVAGVIGIVMLIGLVSAIENRAQETEAGAVPEAASTAEPGGAAPQSDPLVEAGVVPDLPATPTPTSTAPAPILPEQGADARRQGAPPVEQ